MNNRFTKALELRNEINNIDYNNNLIQEESFSANKINDKNIVLQSSEKLSKQTTIRISDQSFQKLNELSKKIGRSRNYIINYLIENFVEIK